MGSTKYFHCLVLVCLLSFSFIPDEWKAGAVDPNAISLILAGGAPDPCDPSPCGPNAECTIKDPDYTANCRCLGGYRGHPPNCY